MHTTATAITRFFIAIDADMTIHSAIAEIDDGSLRKGADLTRGRGEVNAIVAALANAGIKCNHRDLNKIAAPEYASAFHQEYLFEGAECTKRLYDHVQINGGNGVEVVKTGDLYDIVAEDVSLVAAIEDAPNLVALQAALRAVDDYCYEHGLEPDDLYRISDIPNFGGDDPQEGGAYSWDKDSMLVIWDGWSILPRPGQDGSVQRVVLHDPHAGL